MLNTDYKLLAHALANRLQKILPGIISKDQNAYIKQRFIGFNIRTILDAIETTNSNQLKCLIIFLDFEKAFDKLNWSFIDKCLSAFGFGNNFKRWVSTMYTDISSCVINNGFTTPYFKLKCGIRQGCPLSALLFIIAAETLATSIRNNKNIKGITFNDHEVKLTQLADDTTLLLQDIRSLHTARNLLFMFHKSSGLKLNYSKTEILNIGHSYGNKENPFNLKWVKERVYALGTWFYKDIESSIVQNYETRFSSFQSILKTWKSRHLTLSGKITIIKSLALSKLNYCIMTLPTPKWFVEAVQQEINCFLWKNKPPRVKFKTAISCHEKGGLNLTDIDSFVKAQKALWAKRLLDDYQPCSKYLKQFICSMAIPELLMCNMDPEEIPPHIPFFYRQVLYAWFSIKNMSEINLDDIVLWHNIHIKIDKKTFFLKQWYENGIFYLHDLFSHDGTIMTFKELKNKYGINGHQLQYMSVIDAIPSDWRHANLQPTTKTTPKNFIFKHDIHKLKSRMLYTKLIECFELEASCISKWRENYNIVFSSAEWKKIFTLSRKLTPCARIQEMQFKIIHKIYASDSFVSIFDNTVNKNCSQCDIKNNIIHMFVECSLLKDFLALLEKWLKCNFQKECKLDFKTILFGDLNKDSFILNYCLLIAKWYIHQTRQMQKENQKLYFSFTSYLEKLKLSVIVERQIAVDKLSIPEFELKFHELEVVI